MSVNSVTNNAIVIHSSEFINAAIIECRKIISLKYVHGLFIQI